MNTYKEKMARMIPKNSGHVEKEYRHYEMTMDAICSRKPERMKQNGIDMLKAKVGQLHNIELHDDALRALKELESEVALCNS